MERMAEQRKAVEEVERDLRHLVLAAVTGFHRQLLLVQALLTPVAVLD
jgi:hypothetical protein